MSLFTENQAYSFEIFQKDVTALIRCFPALSHGTIGASVLGHPLIYLKIGQGRRNLLLCGAHHGKEWVTAKLVTEIAFRLCCLYTAKERYGEIHAADFLQKNTVWFIPMVNPDGVNLCIHGLTEKLPAFLRSRLIGMSGGKKSFVGNWQANIHGVDLNHNYNAKFYEGKSAAQVAGIYGPGPTRYFGESPESEPESAAMCKWFREIVPAATVTYHAQGEEIYYGFNQIIPPKGKPMAERIRRATGYRLAHPEGIGDYSGFKDWIITEYNLPAFTVEVGHGENPLPLSQFPQIVARNFSTVFCLDE